MYKKDVLNLELEFIEVGNPFETGSTELINIVTNDAMDEMVVKSVKMVENSGLSRNRITLLNSVMILRHSTIL